MRTNSADEHKAQAGPSMFSSTRMSGGTLGTGLLGALLFLVAGFAPVVAQDGDDGKELPEQEVSASIAESTSEEQLVGPYSQPRWTATHQRFGTTRAYVLPPYVFEYEQFVEIENEEGHRPHYELLEELKVGLPYRFQLDLYWTQTKVGSDSLQAGEHKIEVRWALAKWGEIPLNPTLYAEWETELTEDSDGMEYKILLAETLGDNLHWATNLIFEHDLSGDGKEYGISTGLNYNISDRNFGVGIEGEWIREDEDGVKEDEFLLGPSVEWIPSERTSLRLAPLAGLGGHSPDLKTFLIFGYEFGPGREAKGARSGTATSEVR